MSFYLTLIIPAIANSQTSLSSTSSGSQDKFNPWWKTERVKPCGKLWCADVNFPYFPYYSFLSDENITIASRADLQDPKSTANQLEIRSDLVEKTLLSIYQKVAVNEYFQEGNQQTKSQKLDLEHWFLLQDKPLHPLTPKIEVGTKNAQTIIFAPPQPKLGLSKETIITITEDDSIYNGKPINELADTWRKIIQRDISEALWGNEFDLIFPWGRLQIVIIIFLVTLVPIILLTIISHLIRNLDRQFKQKIKELNELHKLEQQASFFKQPESSEIIDDNYENQGEMVNGTIEESDHKEILSNSNNLGDESLQEISLTEEKTNVFLNIIQKFISRKVNNSRAKTPSFSLPYQNILKQFKNLTTFFLQLLIWLRILLLFTGLALAFFVFPNTRTATFFFIVQAIFLPLIWMLVNLADTIAAFAIDYYLNRWAKEGQIAEPNSTRYSLRITTYSPALKGASSLLFIMIGIALTIELLGIDISVLAGAGGAALLVGFLARNVLEDMLNGILILWTDRYAIGDIIAIGDVGGFVENMNLYTTQIRGEEGCLITIPNGQISLVKNKTKDWSRTEFKIEISANSDPVKAIQILQEVGSQMQQDPEWQETILEPVNILGIDQVSHQGILIQVWIKTQPMKQWSVGREFRLRVLQAFTQAEIELGIPQRQVWNLENSSEHEEKQFLS
ncbi:MAG: mechanosensitive ion channel family protein [Xenococcus sp. MO_188.B8]|nr:mechanosensitive ion channel family protein [Xenococcus sp. MO_188.B8]